MGNPRSNHSADRDRSSMGGGNYSGGNYSGGNYSGGNYSGGNYSGGNYSGGNYSGGNSMVNNTNTHPSMGLGSAMRFSRASSPAHPPLPFGLSPAPVSTHSSHINDNLRDHQRSSSSSADYPPKRYSLGSIIGASPSVLASPITSSHAFHNNYNYNLPQTHGFPSSSSSSSSSRHHQPQLETPMATTNLTIDTTTNHTDNHMSTAGRGSFGMGSQNGPGSGGSHRSDRDVVFSPLDSQSMDDQDGLGSSHHRHLGSEHHHSSGDQPHSGHPMGGGLPHHPPPHLTNDDSWQSIACDTIMSLATIISLRHLQEQGLAPGLAPGQGLAPGPPSTSSQRPMTSEEFQTDLNVTFSGRVGGLGGLQLHVLQQSTGAYVHYEMVVTDRDVMLRLLNSNGQNNSHNNYQNSNYTNDSNNHRNSHDNQNSNNHHHNSGANTRRYTSVAHLQIPLRGAHCAVGVPSSGVDLLPLTLLAIDARREEEEGVKKEGVSVIGGSASGMSSSGGQSSRGERRKSAIIPHGRTMGDGRLTADPLVHVDVLLAGRVLIRDMPLRASDDLNWFNQSVSSSSSSAAAAAASSSNIRSSRGDVINVRGQSQGRSNQPTDQMDVDNSDHRAAAPPPPAAAAATPPAATATATPPPTTAPPAAAESTSDTITCELCTLGMFNGHFLVRKFRHSSLSTSGSGGASSSGTASGSASAVDAMTNENGRGRGVGGGIRIGDDHGLLSDREGCHESSSSSSSSSSSYSSSSFSSSVVSMVKEEIDQFVLTAPTSLFSSSQGLGGGSSGGLGGGLLGGLLGVGLLGGLLGGLDGGAGLAQDLLGAFAWSISTLLSSLPHGALHIVSYPSPAASSHEQQHVTTTTDMVVETIALMLRIQSELQLSHQVPQSLPQPSQPSRLSQSTGLTSNASELVLSLLLQSALGLLDDHLVYGTTVEGVGEDGGVTGGGVGASEGSINPSTTGLSEGNFTTTPAGRCDDDVMWEGIPLSRALVEQCQRFAHMCSSTQIIVPSSVASGGICQDLQGSGAGTSAAVTQLAAKSVATKSVATSTVAGSVVTDTVEKTVVKSYRVVLFETMHAMLEDRTFQCQYVGTTLWHISPSHILPSQ